MVHDRRCMALRQLYTALRLYEQQDFYSAITLAGAAEELLGKLLKENSIGNALDSYKKDARVVFNALYGEAPSEKEIATQANDARNKLKHGSPDGSNLIEFDAEEKANDMLDRAIRNVYELVNHNIVDADALTPAIQQFEERHMLGGHDNKQIRP